jgi:hypothetical protein
MTPLASCTTCVTEATVTVYVRVYVGMQTLMQIHVSYKANVPIIMDTTTPLVLLRPQLS